MAATGVACIEGNLVLPPIPTVFLKRKTSGRSKVTVTTPLSRQCYKFISSARRNSFAVICESDLCSVECARINEDLWNAMEHILA